MGELLVKLWRNPKETEDNRALLHQIIEKWLRLVSGLSSSFTDEADNRMDEIVEAKRKYLSAVNRHRTRGCMYSLCY